MLQGEATLGVPVMTREGATLEVLAVVHIDIGQEAEAPMAAGVIVQEGSLGFNNLRQE